MPTKSRHQSIAYEDVIDLLCIADPESWDSHLGDIYPPYILKLDGIYAKPSSRLFGLSEEELLALRPWFPPEQYGDYTQPVCPLPCDAETFVAFVEGAGLWDRVTTFAGFDEAGELLGELTETWVKLGLPTRRPAPGDEPSATPKAALHGRNPATPEWLDKTTMARAFAGLGGRNLLQWRNLLKDPPKDLKRDDVRKHGGGQPESNRWNPVKVAQWLMGKGLADVSEIDHRFKTCPDLAPWRDAWASFTDLPP